MKPRFFSILAAFTVLLSANFTAAQDAPRILLLTKSSGFQHSVIKNDADGTNHVSRILQKLCDDAGAEFTHTKNAGFINAKNLENYDLVIFYTTLNLMRAGSDMQPPMPDSGLDDLEAWISKGGAFMGFHCASDTFHSKGDEVHQYIKMLGGEFKGHGKQFRGTVKVVDPTHPAAAATPQDWKIRDEWYVFKNLNKDNIHVIATLDAGTERDRQPMYDTPDYPITWVSTMGEGRIYYNAMGHREDVWEDADFQATVVAAATWAMGEGPAQAEPNYKKVIED